VPAGKAQSGNDAFIFCKISLRASRSVANPLLLPVALDVLRVRIAVHAPVLGCRMRQARCAASSSAR